jgi:hypothetical protein
VSLMSQTDSAIRLWGRPPTEVVAERFPPERSRWRDKSDDQLLELSRRIHHELTQRRNRRYDATGDAREHR